MTTFLLWTICYIVAEIVGALMIAHQLGWI